jgi:hypothetical protein
LPAVVVPGDEQPSIYLRQGLYRVTSLGQQTVELVEGFLLQDLGCDRYLAQGGKEVQVARATGHVAYNVWPA